MIFESLENRQMLNVDWRNPLDSLDVDTDGSVTPLDVLTDINFINSGTGTSLPNSRGVDQPYYDVDGDLSVSPLDVLTLINHLNAPNGSSRLLNEAYGGFASQSELVITLGQTAGTRHYQVGIHANFDKSDTTSKVEDTFNVYLLDPNARTKSLLDNGTNGTPILTMSDKSVSAIAGRVTWDGSILDIDLSDLQSLDTGVLVFQLLNNDKDFGTSVSIQPKFNSVDLDATETDRPSLNQTSKEPGGTISLGNLQTIAQSQFEISNARFSVEQSTLDADIRVRTNDKSLSKNIAIVFPGLPSNDQLINATGTTTDGKPFISIKNSVPMGGLPLSTWSDFTHVQFVIHDVSPFINEPELRGSENHAPVLPSLPALSGSPGGIIRLALGATDADGDPISYNLTGATNLPSGEIGSNGELILRPLASEIGHYTFNVVASDGSSSTQQSTTLDIVADTNTNTRVSGRILKVDGTPIVGIRVEIGSVQSLTNSTGAFTLDLGSGPVISDTIRVRGDLMSGAAAFPFIGEKLPLLLEHDIVLQSNNQLDRPIYLPVLDIDHATQIDPTKDEFVKNPALPGTELYVAADTLMNLQGSPFTGKLSITQVPVNLTPAALPANLVPDLVVTIQPGEMVFARPAPLSLPNSGGWGPGTLMDLWSINPVTGLFDDVGDMQVSADGMTIDTISGGVRNSSWHFASPSPSGSPTRGRGRNEDDTCKKCEETKPLTSQIESHSGALIETHDLVPYTSQGQARSLTLNYNSLRADPRPIVHFGIDELNSAALFPGYEERGRLVAQIHVKEGGITAIVPGAPAAGDPSRSIPPRNLADDVHFWSLQGISGPVDAALQVDLSTQPSGVYHYELDSGVYLYSGSIENGAKFVGSSSVRKGDLVSVNSIQSSFGAGWGIAGMEELVRTYDGSMLLIDGAGSQLLFKWDPANSKFISPPGEFSALSVLDGKFVRSMPNQETHYFNINYKIGSIADRNNNLTKFIYDSQNRPISIIDPVGLTTTFTYTGDRVTSITDPANRVTKLEYDAVGNLTRITDPDGSNRTFSYDALHHQTGEIDQLGRQETDLYGFHGRVISAIRKDGSTIHIGSPETDGLLEPDATSDWSHAPSVFQLSADAKSTYVDSRGNVLTSVLDQSGQSVSQQDSLGAMAKVIRDSNNLPIQVVNARGLSTNNTFDAKGNLVSTRDGLSVRVGSDPTTIGIINGVLQHGGQSDTYTFNAKAGEIVWIDPIKGSVSYSMYAPSGQYVYQTLTEDGEYKVVITGSIGEYSLLIRSISDASAMQLDTEFQQRIENHQDIFYKVTAKKDQRLVLTETYPSTTNHYWSIIASPKNLTKPSTSAYFTITPATPTSPEINETLIPADGDYYLLRSDSLTQSDLDFQITDKAQLLDPEVVTVSGFGDIHAGTVPAGQSVSFTFAAPQGTVVYFDNLISGASSNTFSITDPMSRLWQSYVSGGPLILPLSGTYTIKIAANPNADGAYNFRMLSFDSASPWTFGKSYSGVLKNHAAMMYVLHGNKDDTFLLDATSDKDVFHSPLASPMLYDSYGNTISTGFSDTPFTIPITGDYYFVLDDSQQNTSDSVNFNFRSTNAKTIPEYRIGDEVRGTLRTEQDKLYYRIVNTTERIFFYKPLNFSSDPQVTFVLGSSNASPPGYYSSSTGYVQFYDGQTTRVPKDVFLVVTPWVIGYGGFPQNLHARIIATTSHKESIRLGQTVTHTININEIDDFSFDATAGTWIQPELIKTDPAQTLYFNLVGPDGATVSQIGDSNLTHIKLPTTGTYHLTLSASNWNIGKPQTISLRLIPLQSGPIVSMGSPFSGTLATGSNLSVYQFIGAQGQRVKFDQGTSTSNLKIFDRYGSLVADSKKNPSIIVSFADSQTYSLLVTNQDTAATQPLAYQWTISDASQTPVTSSGFNTGYHGTANEGDLLATISGNAGTRVYYASKSLAANMGRIIQVIGPTGNVVSKFANSYNGYNDTETHQGIIVLPESGSYQIFMRGDFAPLTSPQPYAMAFWDEASMPKLTFNVKSTVTVLPGNIIAPMRLDATAGQFLDINASFPASTPQQTYLYYNTSLEGQDLHTGSGFTGRLDERSFLWTQLIHESGTYVLSLTNNYGASDESVNNLAFTISDLRQSPLIPSITSFSGNAVAYEDVSRTVQLTAGDQLLFTTESFGWYLYNLSDGTGSYITPYLIANSTSREGLYTVPKTGTYSLLRTGSATPGAYSFSSVFYAPLKLPLVGGALSKTSLTYDSKFNTLSSVTDEQGRVTLYDINAINGNVRSQTQVVGTIGGADDLTTQFSYLPAGQIDTVIDELGHVTDYDYDALGRMTKLTKAKGTASETVDSFEYDSAGNLTASIDPNNNRSVYAYDSMGRLTQYTDPSGNLFSTAYDKRGNSVTITDPLGHITRRTYDAMDRVITVTDAKGGSLTNKYDASGNVISTQDGVGDTIRLKYDVRNRLVASTDNNGATTRYQYDADGNLTGVVDSNSNTTSIALDARSRQVSELDANGHATGAVYDGTNKLVVRKDKLGRQEKFDYDEAGRLIADHWIDATGVETNVINYSYDIGGRLIEFQDHDSHIHVTYDDLDRVIDLRSDSVDSSVDSEFLYSWDANSNLQSMSSKMKGLANVSNQYTYDANDRLVRIVQSGGGSSNKRVDLSYNAMSQQQSVMQYSDLQGTSLVSKTSIAFDALNRIASIEHTNSSNSKLDSFQFTYDAISRIESLTEPAGMTTYAYNAQDELSAADHVDPTNPDETYSYDANGNRISQNGSNGFQIAKGNRLSSDGKFDYSYDAEGNLVQQTNISSNAVREFQYDLKNRLVEITDRVSPTGTVTQVVRFRYDVFGHRISKLVDTTPADAVDGKTTWYVYDGVNLLAEWTDADGSGPTSPQLSMRYMNGIAVDQVFAQEGANGQVLWDLADQLGSVRDLINNQGQVVNHLTYDSFGQLVSASSPTIETHYHFAGREFDPETGLQYNRARYYDPRTGRFLQEDPSGLLGSGSNLYRYANNSPNAMIDATGEIPLPIITGAIGGGMAFVANVGSQYYKTGDLSKIKWKDAFVAGAFGAATGAAVGFKAVGMVGSVVIGAVGNVAQYWYTTDTCQQTLSGFVNAAVFGAVGGAIGGAATIPLKQFAAAEARAASFVGHDVLNGLGESTRAIVKVGRDQLSRQWMAAQLGGKTLAQNFLGANAQNIDVTGYF